MRISTFFCWALFAGMAAWTAGCDRAVTVRGVVHDVQGQTLPGVAVTDARHGFQATTNVLGEYTLRTTPGAITLNLIKMGYTSGRLEVTVDEPRTVEAAEVVLWPLPIAKGVYFHDDFVYTELTRAEPRRYTLAQGQAVFATRKGPEVAARDASPVLVAYRMPLYNARLYRMHEIEAVPPTAETEGVTERVWAPDEDVFIRVAAVDEPERLLQEMAPVEPLAPGVYGVHWGALDGRNPTDPHVYYFEVLDDEEEVETHAEDEPAPGDEGETGDAPQGDV